jgi:hypothetical protein
MPSAGTILVLVLRDLRRHTAGQKAIIGQSYSIPHRASGVYRVNPAHKPSVQSTSNRDTKSQSSINHINKKEARMVKFKFDLNAKLEACFHTHLRAVALSGCIAVAAAAHGPSGTQPYAP